MKWAVALSTGSHLPEKVVANQDVVQFPETVNGSIAPKTGVVTRRHTEEGECTSGLTFQAALNCLKKVDFPAGRIEGIIVSTSSPDRYNRRPRCVSGIGSGPPMPLPSTSTRSVREAPSESAWRAA